MQRTTRHAGLLSLALLCLLVLVPNVALAADSSGSDTGAFERALAEHGMLFAIGACYLGGLVASLTPCVWPMIPITVSIFGATESQSRMRGAGLSATYVLGIATLFTPLGIIAAFTGKGMGAALANPYVVCVIALVFLALAASMFGAFELALPASLTNRVSNVGGVGFGGAFVLGLVLGLIAAPCTGPFLTGLLIWIANSKNVLIGGVAMFSFAIGLGTPFFAAGTFALNLPRGGAWMMGIKWGSGVVLAYMGFKYLRDRWPEIFRSFISPTTLMLVVFIAVAVVGLGLGVVHILAERRKSPIAHLSKPMKLASIIPAVLGLYLTLSWFDVPRASIVPDANAAAGLPPAPEMTWEKNEEKGIAQATTEKKPVLVDFGATWCTACKELEHETWPDPRVRTEAKRFVTIAVDATDDDDKKIIELKKKYKVVGLPTVVLLDASGKEVSRFTEFVKADRMAEAMKKVN